MNGFALEGLPVGQLAVQDVKDDLAYFLSVNNLKGLLNALYLNLGGIVLLASGGGINGALIENHNVSLALIEHVGENIHNLSLEVHQVVILVVQVISLGQVHCAVKNGLRSLGNSLLSLSNFVVEVTWDGLLGDLRDAVSGNTPRLHGDDPVIDGQLAILALLQEFLEVLFLNLIGVLPPVKLNLDNVIE